MEPRIRDEPESTFQDAIFAGRQSTKKLPVHTGQSSGSGVRPLPCHLTPTTVASKGLSHGGLQAKELRLFPRRDERDRAEFSVVKLI